MPSGQREREKQGEEDREDRVREDERGREVEIKKIMRVNMSCSEANSGLTN